MVAQTILIFREEEDVDGDEVAKSTFSTAQSKIEQQQEGGRMEVHSRLTTEVSPQRI